MRSNLFVVIPVVACLLAAPQASASEFLIDLTHPFPIFQLMEGDATKPDTARPWLDSKPGAAFGSACRGQAA